MARVQLPRYTRPRQLADGTVAYFWELPTWARPRKVNGTVLHVERHGVRCPVISTALGTDLGKAIEKANGLCEVFDDWREGRIGTKVIPGSIKWLFDWYRTHDRFQKVSAKTRADYRAMMDAVCDLPMKDGTRFATRSAKLVDAGVADNIRKRLAEQGSRKATYAMAVCQRVWNEAIRYTSLTGITHNPFAKMGLSGAQNENRPTSRAEYDLYRETAHAMGLQMMATAAALSFEVGQRVWDVFGFEDDDGRKARGILWAGYRPGVSLTVTQSKRGAHLTIRLIGRVEVAPGEWEVLPLYPDLEDELARTARLGDAIVIDPDTGKPFAKRKVSKLHRAICDRAGLPKEMKFTGFRHGAATEMGDAGVDDMRAVTGHRQVETSTIYNKANEEKSEQIGLKRRAHVVQLSERRRNAVSE